MSAARRLAVIAIAAVVAGGLLVALQEDEEPQRAAEPEQAATTGGGDDASASNPGAGGEQPEKQKPEKQKKPEEPELATIVIEGGEPAGGVQELSFQKGEQIRFAVESDVADHVHLHGYDVFQDIAAGGRVEFSVPATIEGVFEVELEDRVVPIAEITVEPS